MRPVPGAAAGAAVRDVVCGLSCFVTMWFKLFANIITREFVLELVSGQPEILIARVRF